MEPTTVGLCARSSCSPQEINFFFFNQEKLKFYFKREREGAHPKNSPIAEVSFQPPLLLILQKLNLKEVQQNAKLERWSYNQKCLPGNLSFCGFMNGRPH